MKFISQKVVDEAVKYLVSGAGGDHLPYTDSSGKPNHRLLGAAWAALHGGYRGNKYEGPDKMTAIEALRAHYKAAGMDTPQESYALPCGEFFDEALKQDDSYRKITEKVVNEINRLIRSGQDMDCDGDGEEDARNGYAFVQDIYPDTVVYEMENELFQAPYTISGDKAVIGTPVPVDLTYVPSTEGESEESLSEATAMADTPEEGKTHQVLSMSKFKPIKCSGKNGCSTWAKGTDSVHVQKDGSWEHGAKSGADANALVKHMAAQSATTESHGRVLVSECQQFNESGYDSSKGKLTITVIKPGMSKNKRFYSESLLKNNFGIFKGAKMFADHQTEAEAKAKPENSVNNWVATLDKPWVESDGTVMASATVIDPTFKTKLDLLASNKQLGEMGISIRAVGESMKGVVDGQKCDVIESLLSCRSVDFVTFAAAGGRVEMIESDIQETDIELVSEEILRTKRKDLVEIIESSAVAVKTRTLEEAMKDLNIQLQEAQAEIATLKPKADKLVTVEAEVVTLKAEVLANKTKMEESEKAARKAVASADLTKLLTEAKLPEIATKRIKAQFAEAEKVDGMKEAISGEAEYIKSLGVTPKHNGSADNSNSGAGISEADKKKNFDEAVEGYKRLGLTEEQAKHAAASKRVA